MRVCMIVGALLDNIVLKWLRHSEVDWLFLIVVLLFFRGAMRFLVLSCWLASFCLLFGLSKRRKVSLGAQIGLSVVSWDLVGGCHHFMVRL